MSNQPATAVAFTPYEISLCLHDATRTRMWKAAIESVVKPGDVVIDAGSGTGILAVFAALAGAKRVYCIELHPRFVTLIENLAARNGLSDKLIVIHGDATKIEIPEPADVLISELLCTGLFFEPQIQVVNHLTQFLKPHGKIIPRRVRSHVQLLDAQEMLYGVRIDCDSRSHVYDDDEPVSTQAQYDDLEMSANMPVKIENTVEVTALRTGLADAVKIEGEAELAKDMWTKTTKFLFNPEVIFLKDPVQLVQGDTAKVSLSYYYGGDTLDATIRVKPQ